MDNNYIIKNFELRHLNIPELGLEPEVKTSIELNCKEIAFAKTVFYKDGTLLGIGVFFDRYSTGKHYEINLMVNKDLFKMALRYKFAAIKVTRKVVALFSEKLSPERLQANCLANMKLFQRFAEGIGFEREGLMRKFGFNSEDYYRYSIVW